MTTLLLVIGSVRPGRVGVPVANWARERIETDGRFEVDVADLAELNLPFMDEPNHPTQRRYQHAHTIAWSERVDAADAILLVTPEYNHSFSPALKNALDYLSQEWWRKPVGFISYGGISAGTRGVNAIENVVVGLGMVKTGSNVEIPFVGTRLADGVFTPDERMVAILDREIDELVGLAETLRPLQNR
jgi:NAD(P)H-dependent FMN reductase